MKKKILAIVGARPQFIKHFPFEKEARKYFDLITLHTGQHYDDNMSQIFFKELGMKKPDFTLHLGGGSHGYQTGRMLIDIEKVLLDEKPDGVVVYGDTNSTLAGALASAKIHTPVFHIEAGLRSFNKKMPEEINRILTDQISSLLFITSEKAKENLNNEGIKHGIFPVGDLMKDLLFYAISESKLERKEPDNYFYVTLHRPYNVDKENRLKKIILTLSQLERKVVFAVHPRTKKRIHEFGLMDSQKFHNIKLIPPQSYFNNLSYLYYSSGIITDSGGMQKEAYWLKKPCVTIRSETEWIETLKDNANTLIFDDLDNLPNSFIQKPKYFDPDLYGDGSAAIKICQVINNWFNEQEQNNIL